MKNIYALKIIVTLKRGKRKLRSEVLDRMTAYVRSQQLADGTFCNRHGDSDIYYTAFGWMLIYALNMPFDKKQARYYLRNLDFHNMTLSQYASYEFCHYVLILQSSPLQQWLKTHLPHRLLKREQLSDFADRDYNAPYPVFLWLCMLEIAHHKLPDKDEVLSALQPYKVAGGGYTNMLGETMASTNATAAAVAVIGMLSGWIDADEARLLNEWQDGSGGYAITKTTPWPDLLSTSTALFTLKCYNIKPEIIPKTFIEAHWSEKTGGFMATVLEDTSDMEYTFYGLLALGTL